MDQSGQMEQARDKMKMTEAQMDLLQRCWQSGYDAYCARISKNQSPLAKGSAAHKAWQDGWRKAQFEHEELCDENFPAD